MFSKLLSLHLLGAVIARQSEIAIPGINFYFPNTSSPQRFKIKVDECFLDMTTRKIRDYRPTTGLSADWGVEGPPTQNITDVATYWSLSYNWHDIENQINKNFEHYATTVLVEEGYPFSIPLHFIHHRSDDNNAVPLLLLHGWPSSFLEWSKVMGPLSQDPLQSFHIIAPDLPGFGFSPAPEQPGLGPREMGKAFHALMQQLGYERYGIVTTDIGWFIGMWMVHDAQESIVGHMSDFFIAQPNATDRDRFDRNQTTMEEAAYIAAFDAWFTHHWAYATVHGQKPLALSLALADSPMGLLGWFWDVSYATSGDYVYKPEELITDAMMLWIPGPYANIRVYLETFKPEVMDFKKTDVPTGVSEWSFSNGPFLDIADFPFVPPDWIKRTANLVYFNRYSFGGHYPAVSQPELWAQDVKRFFYGIQSQYPINQQPVKHDEL